MISVGNDKIFVSKCDGNKFKSKNNTNLYTIEMPPNFSILLFTFRISWNKFVGQKNKVKWNEIQYR